MIFLPTGYQTWSATDAPSQNTLLTALFQHHHLSPVPSLALMLRLSLPLLSFNSADIFLWEQLLTLTVTTIMRFIERENERKHTTWTDVPLLKKQDRGWTSFGNRTFNLSLLEFTTEGGACSWKLHQWHCTWLFFKLEQTLFLTLTL